MTGTEKEKHERLLIKRCIAFADWAAGEGICPVGYNDPEAEDRNPDEFLFAYSQATGDEDWSSLADRLSAVPEGDKPAPVGDNATLTAELSAVKAERDRLVHALEYIGAVRFGLDTNANDEERADYWHSLVRTYRHEANKALAALRSQTKAGE